MVMDQLTVQELFDKWEEAFFNIHYYYRHEGRYRRVYGLKPAYDWCFQAYLGGLDFPVLVNDDELVYREGRLAE